MVAILPQPRFGIGDPVWVVYSDTVDRRVPCPDCLDSKTWEATSAVGETFRVSCPRCQTTNWSLSKLPPLARREATFRVRQLTVGSIQMDTNVRDGESVFKYMCAETGIGSGNVYNETGRWCVYGSEAEALAAAEIEQRDSQARLDALPVAIRAADYAQWPLQVALPYEWREDVYHAWDTARDFREAAQEIIHNEHSEYSSVEEIHDKLRDVMQPRPWRKPHPVDELIAAARAALSQVEGEVRTALESALARLRTPQLAGMVDEAHVETTSNA